MSNRFDELVNNWLLDKFIGSHYYKGPDSHGTRDQMKVITADAGWECGCYSDYTREDEYIFRAAISVKGDPENLVDYKYGHWGSLPAFIEEIRDGDNDNEACPYWDED